MGGRLDQWGFSSPIFKLTLKMQIYFRTPYFNHLTISFSKVEFANQKAEVTFLMDRKRVRLSCGGLFHRSVDPWNLLTDWSLRLSEGGHESTALSPVSPMCPSQHSCL